MPTGLPNGSWGFRIGEMWRTQLSGPDEKAILLLPNIWMPQYEVGEVFTSPVTVASAAR